MAGDPVMRQIEQALAGGDVARAAILAEAALAQGRRDPMLLNLAAWRREEAGDYDGARALLDRALALAPGDPLIRIGIATVLRKQQRFEDAIALLDQVLAAMPTAIAAWLERGYALDAIADAMAARESFARAAALDPACAPAWAGGAAAAARVGDMATVRDHAARALAIEPGNPGATCALAALWIGEGEAARAAAALRAALAGALPPEDEIVARRLLGDACDRLGDTDAAFAAYATANAAYAGSQRARALRGEPSHTEFVRHLDDQLAALGDAAWRTSAGEVGAGEPATHAFLIGYPRSGTTLTETILATLPEVATLEERPTLAAADRAFLLPRGGLARLAAIDAAEARRYRDDYWRAVARDGVDDRARTFVDMDPLKTIRLPIVARLFPAARILFMRRDPRDVVWSCFRHAFRVSAASLELVTLERAARHYDAVMRLAERCRATMPLAIHDISYRRLVNDFDGETRALCRFVGLPWSETLRDFGDTAARRGIRTASAPQVRRGLYDGGGQWRAYAAYLEPVLPILQPWIDRVDALDRESAG